jgi:hypothetical protein
VTGGIGRTYVEHVKDPDKVIPPNHNLVLISRRIEESEGPIPFTLLSNLSLNLCHCSAIEPLVSESLGVHVAGLAHVVSCPIAPSTDWLRSSNRLPLTPRYKA